MKILNVLQSIAEKILNRSCEKCKHYKDKGFVCDLNDFEYQKCVSGILPRGFERRLERDITGIKQSKKISDGNKAVTGKNISATNTYRERNADAQRNAIC